MRNRILSIIRDGIPYIKELRPVAGSVTAAILMQQLDYWFARYPNGIYKFLEPCDHKLYKQADSLTEELGFSAEEVIGAFKLIGVRYKSKTQFKNATDKFQGKFYCSVFDRMDGRTFYFRNHELVDEALDKLAMSVSNSYQKSTPVNRLSRFTETDFPGLDLYTEITPVISNTVFATENEESRPSVMASNRKSVAKKIKEPAAVNVAPAYAPPLSEDEEKSNLVGRLRSILGSKPLPRNIQSYAQQCSLAQLKTTITAVEKKLTSGEDVELHRYTAGVLKGVLNLDNPPTPHTPEKGLEFISGSPTLVDTESVKARILEDKIQLDGWCSVPGTRITFQVQGLFMARDGAVWGTDDKSIARPLFHNSTDHAIRRGDIYL